MPTSQGIAVHLHLQREYGSHALMEYAPSSVPAAIHDHEEATALDDGRTATVFTPVFPTSRFWIAYQVNTKEVISTYFYFKLIVDGRHIVSWGTGEKEKYQGSTKYALFKADLVSEARLLDAAQRGFTFPSCPAAGCIEVQVYRSNARRRRHRGIGLETYKPDYTASNKEAGISLRHTGHTSDDKHPKFFDYALVDPPANPWVKFRFLYRSMDPLRTGSHSNQTIVDARRSLLCMVIHCFKDAKDPIEQSFATGSSTNPHEVEPAFKINDSLDRLHKTLPVSRGLNGVESSRVDVDLKVVSNRVRRIDLLFGSPVHANKIKETNGLDENAAGHHRIRSGWKGLKAMIAATVTGYESTSSC